MKRTWLLLSLALFLLGNFVKGAIEDEEDELPDGEVDPAPWMGAYINPPGKSWIVARPNESVWDLVGDLRDKHINEMFEYFDLRFGAWKGPHDEGFPVECTLYSRLEQKSCAFLFHYQGAEEGPYVPIPLLHGAKSKCYNIRDFKQKSPRGYVEVPRRSSEAEAMPFLFRHFEREPLPGWKKPPTQGREEDDKTYLFLSLRVQGQTEIELFEQESCRTTRDSMWLNPTAFEDWEHSGFEKKPFVPVEEPAHYWRYFNVRTGSDKKVYLLSEPSYDMQERKMMEPPNGGAGMSRSCACPSEQGNYPTADDSEYLHIWNLLSNHSDYFPWSIKKFAETDEERVATLKALTSRDTPGIITSKIIDLALKNTGVFWSESSEGIEEIRKQIQTFLHKESGSLLRLPWPDPCGTEQTSVARGVKSIRIRSLTPTEIEFLRMDEKERATWQKEKAEDAESQGAMGSNPDEVNPATRQYTCTAPPEEDRTVIPLPMNIIPIVNVTKAVKNNKMALKASALDKMSFRNFALSFDFLLTEKQNTNLVYFQKDVKAKDKMGQDVMLKEFFTVLVEASGKFKAIMGIAGDHRNIIEYDFGGARAFGAWVELGVVINSIDPADTKLEITLNGMSRLNESLWSSNWNMMSLGRSWMDMGWFGGETGLVEEDMGSLPYVKCQPFKGYVTNAVIFQYPFSNTQMKQLYITSDVNECAIPSFPNCDGNAFCVNQPASFQCMCKPGYTGDGVTCTQLSLDAGQMADLMQSGDVEGIKQAVGCGTDMPDCSRIGDRSAATCEKSVGELLPEMGGNNVKVKDMCKAMCNTCAEQLGGLDAVSAAGDIGV